MKLADIPEGPRTGLYLALTDNDTWPDGVEVVGWSTNPDDALWWKSRPGVRVVHAMNITEAGERAES